MDSINSSIKEQKNYDTKEYDNKPNRQKRFPTT
jgi:hypothetical protein